MTPYNYITLNVQDSVLILIAVLTVFLLWLIVLMRRNNMVKITCPNHGYKNGDIITLSGGMVETNCGGAGEYVVRRATKDTFYVYKG